jgi:Golgi phosphoprotein 3 (GPP34)
MAPGLGGTGRVGDDLWLLAHNDYSGKPYIAPRAVGLGVAGGLLAELLLAGHADVWHGGAVVADGRAQPRDGLARHVLGLVAGEREQRPVRDWLAYLARTAARDVAHRLEQAGYLRRAGARMPGRAARWVPVNSDWAFAPLLRVRSAVDASRPVAVPEVVLAGLADACGLGFRFTEYVPPRARRSVTEAAGLLPPALRELITHTEAAVGSAVLAHRV